VNGCHVHAVGWVLTTNALTLTPPEARELAELWRNLVRMRPQDLRQVPPLRRLLFPRALSLSPSTENALATLVDRMAAQHPERFAGEALRHRRDHWARQAALGFPLSVLAAILVPQGWSLAGAVRRCVFDFFAPFPPSLARLSRLFRTLLGSGIENRANVRRNADITVIEHGRGVDLKPGDSETSEPLGRDVCHHGFVPATPARPDVHAWSLRSRNVLIQTAM